MTKPLPNKKLVAVVFYIEGDPICACPRGYGLLVPTVVDQQGDSLLAVSCRKCGATAFGHAETDIRVVEHCPELAEITADLDAMFENEPMTKDAPS